MGEERARGRGKQDEADAGEEGRGKKDETLKSKRLP